VGVRLKPWMCVAVISSQLNDHYPLFYRGKYAAARFLFALVFCAILTVTDARIYPLHQVRYLFSFVLVPLQSLVDYPVQLVIWAQNNMRSRSHLLAENQQLRYQQMLLEVKLQKWIAIQDENTQLKQLLSAMPATEEKTMMAEIFSADTTLSRQVWVINKGRREGLHEGQPVLDAKGVVGQVIERGASTSTVLLISDSTSAVPVRNSRTGEQAILVGANRIDLLHLINMPKTAGIKAGDYLVTSGLGGRYPEGYPVGIVTDVRVIPGEDFLKVAVKPVADLNKDRMVLLLWSERRG